VPVKGAGGTWSTGIDDARTLGTGRAYDSFGWFQNYRTTTSASPLAVVTLGGNGLALAIPPTAPAIYRLTYQPPYGFQVEWEVGAAPDTTAFPQAAQVGAGHRRQRLGEDADQQGRAAPGDGAGGATLGRDRARRAVRRVERPGELHRR